MSELIQHNDNCATIRWKLLTGASALALTAYVSSAALAKAEDAGQPQIWIELGGQLSHLQDSEEAFTAPFETMRPSIFSPSGKFERPPLYSLEEFARISFQPEDSSWIFSASIRYGRALKDKNSRQETNPGALRFNHYPTLPSSYAFYSTRSPRAARFADTQFRSSQQHTILDFQAGKDVGLGMFGKNSSSTVSLGVRFAQFREKSNAAHGSDPDWHFKAKYYYSFKTVVEPYHSNTAALTAQRSFRGVGPSLSWSASAPFAGNPQDGELTFDWGLNAAALFGRQRTRTQHHTTVRYNTGGLAPLLIHNTPGNGYGVLATVSKPPPVNHTRSRNVTVPNVGGSIGLTWRVQDFKMSFGYKADFFFGAIDGGIDTAKKENRGFYGPYASISIGLGD